MFATGGTKGNTETHTDTARLTTACFSSLGRTEWQKYYNKPFNGYIS
jgi:hypothetical protein